MIRIFYPLVLTWIFQMIIKIFNFFALFIFCILLLNCSSSDNSHSNSGSGNNAIGVCAASAGLNAKEEKTKMNSNFEWPVQLFNSQLENKVIFKHQQKISSKPNENFYSSLANNISVQITDGVHLANNASQLTVGADTNVIPLSVGCGYENQPCVTVKICVPGSTTNCVTISNLLLDTGSSGLRVFKSALGGFESNLTNYSTSQGGAMAECVQYGDLTTHWGPLLNADIMLGQSVATNMTFQLIDPAYTGAPPCSSVCTKTNADTQMTGYNGILGVSPTEFDCGNSCQLAASASYFSCPSNTSCSAIGAQTSGSTNLQIRNPVFKTATDNNGVILQFPSINSSSGVPTLNGNLVLGIGTRTNNTPPQNVLSLNANNLGYFYTNLNNIVIDAYIDSGSEALFLPTNTLPTCSITNSFLCPSTLTQFSAQLISHDNLTQVGATFTIANTNSLSSSNNVFDNLGADIGNTTTIMWGFPFFIGNTVYVGYGGKSTPLGTGPFWAF